MTAPAPLSIFESADLLGRYRYVELALFVAAGSAAARVDAPALCLALSGASHAHAYRAALVEARLPVSVGLPHAEESTRVPSSGHGALLDELASLDGAELAAVLASVWYPAMLDGYRSRLEAASAPADGPVQRMLGRLVFDLERSRVELARAVEGEPLDATPRAAALDLLGGPFGTLQL